MDDILEKIGELPDVEVQPGDAIIKEGVPADGLFFLVSGSVEIVAGGFRIAESRNVGAVFGEMSFLLETTPSATVRALEPSKFKLARNRAEFLSHHPEAVSHIAMVLARRLDSLNRYIVDFKRQFADRGDHLGMMGDILSSIAGSQPKAGRRELRPVDEVDD
ncbi:MAG: cyclic nucleotide-binding domain-containing protein [Verrucomicrobiota bacterium]